VARKCGFLKKGQDMDNITLQHYIDMYRQPLSEESLEAISKLSEMAVEKKKMKKVKKNNKACLGRLLCP
jgi:predicted solute-binding protein